MGHSLLILLIFSTILKLNQSFLFSLAPISDKLFTPILFYSHFINFYNVCFRMLSIFASRYILSIKLFHVELYAALDTQQKLLDVEFCVFYVFLFRAVGYLSECDFPGIILVG
jgi:hypothetical protein